MTKSHPCAKCKRRGLYSEPGTICYWCRERRSPLQIARGIIDGVEQTMGGTKAEHEVVDEFEQERLRLRKRKWKTPKPL